jgi:PadR family transcriptional regulator, regulatory protein PadR
MAKNDVLQGTLDLLILKTLASRGPIHGYGITAHIQRISESALRVEEGSLYPALRRLEQDGLIEAEWQLSETNRRARFYKLTSKGRKQLKAVEENWRTLTGAVARVLQYE